MENYVSEKNEELGNIFFLFEKLILVAKNVSIRLLLIVGHLEIMEKVRTFFKTKIFIDESRCKGLKMSKISRYLIFE